MMKKINIIILSLLTILPLRLWAASTFTNITIINDHAIVAGVKSVEPGMEMQSHLLEVNASTMSSRTIKLPRELESREIVGLLGDLKGFLVVVTQITRGGGDKPQVHRFDTSKNVWKKMGEVDCISFSKVAVTSAGLEFSCEQTDNEGKVSEVIKKVALQFNLKPSKFTLPVTKIAQESLKASLEGEEFEWKRLKVIHGKKEKVFTP